MLILGNIIALISSIIMVLSGIIKNKNKIIIAQTLQISLASLSNVILGGYTGCLINLLCCYRNIICYKNKLDNFNKTIIAILSLILTILFNNMGIVGFLPLLSMILFLLFMNTKNINLFKIITIISTVTWLIYDYYICSYTSCMFDLLCICTNAISIIYKKNKGCP